MNPERRRSQHPIDELVRSLITRSTAPTVAEMGRIKAHISTAEFLSPESLRLHCEARIRDRQWPNSADEQSYLDDLRAGAATAASIGLYVRRGGRICLAIASTLEVLTEPGAASLPALAIVYSADWGRIISGYQLEGAHELSLPDDVLWGVE